MPIIDKDQLRTTHIADSNAIGFKQRHGFFSVPISTAIGDDGPYKTQIRIPIIIEILETKWESHKPARGIFRPLLQGQDS